MGIGVMILGASGSGKSASLRNFKANEVGVINVIGKPLPFRTDIKTVNTDDYRVIRKCLDEAKARSIVIDDSQYLMADEFMIRAKENGFQKFTDIGRNFWDLVRYVNQIPDDKIVYFLHHTETDENGVEKAKTIGKLLNEKITLEGMFTIVLKAEVIDGQYFFATKNNGHDVVKAPMGMFEKDHIENDLKLVDDTIRGYFPFMK